MKKNRLKGLYRGRGGMKCAYGGGKHASRPRQAAAKGTPTIPVVRVMQSALVGSFRILKLEYARRIAPE